MVLKYYEGLPHQQLHTFIDYVQTGLSSLRIMSCLHSFELTMCTYSSLHTYSAAICPDPPQIDHGHVNFSGNCIGDYAHYYCDPGFKLKGDPYLTCERLDNYIAAFQPNPPVCRREC